MSENRPITFLCLASDFKGLPFLREAKKQGCRVLLIMAQKSVNEAWPWECIDEHFAMPTPFKEQDLIYAVSYLVRTRHLDRIVALDDYDVAMAASLREHLRLAGMGETTARHYRDKLAMRLKARESGMAVPEFSSVFNYDDLRDFLNRVPGPWVLKPRFDAGSIGIQKVQNADEVWAALEKLGDQQSFYLIEKFVPGNVYHVDAILWGKQMIFARASRYGVPPLALTRGGGVFTTRVLENDSEEGKALLALNVELHKAFGLVRGVTHTEFIRGEDGRYYFLETAARVGGANIDKLVEMASGVVLWAEAARIEIASVLGAEYQLPPLKELCAGLITCLARHEHPDLSHYNAPEVVWQVPKAYHAGLIVASPSSERVQALLDEYAQRFSEEFMVVAPPKTVVRHQI